MAHAISNTTPALFAELADLLERASRLMRQLSEGAAKSKPVSFSIPKLKRPKHIPKDQEWFWTKEWQAGERKVDEALARGEFKEFNTAEEMLADLHAHV